MQLIQLNYMQHVLLEVAGSCDLDLVTFGTHRSYHVLRDRPLSNFDTRTNVR